MAKDTNIYVPIWSKYKPAIVHLMQNALKEDQAYKMSSHEFTDISTRKVYSFNLEIENGNFRDNTKLVAIARDLKEVIMQSAHARKMLADNTFTFSMGKDFVLKIHAKSFTLNAVASES